MVIGDSEVIINVFITVHPHCTVPRRRKWTKVTEHDLLHRLGELECQSCQFKISYFDFHTSLENTPFYPNFRIFLRELLGTFCISFSTAVELVAQIDRAGLASISTSRNVEIGSRNDNKLGNICEL